MKRAHKDPMVRLMRRVEVDPETQCWNFTGSIDPYGYGRFGLGSRQLYKMAHRASYELHVGQIPNGLVLDHICRNRRCVNPAHLEPVTNKENILRGNGAPAQAARRDACQKGHPLQPAPLGHGRYCPVCLRARSRANKRAEHQRRVLNGSHDDFLAARRERYRARKEAEYVRQHGPRPLIDAWRDPEEEALGCANEP